jgi:hypothetical protein
VIYADDLVILCRKGKAAEALSRLREIMGLFFGNVEMKDHRIPAAKDMRTSDRCIGYTGAWDKRSIGAIWKSVRKKAAAKLRNFDNFHIF